MIIIQLTGLSGSGKTTIATLTKAQLTSLGIKTEIIDGDTYRETLCKDLGFSEEDRKENIRRLGNVAYTFAKQGIVSIISAISPFESSRQELTTNYGAKIVWINCPLALLIERDTKGLYRKALLPQGNPERIENFTGISQQYDTPTKPDLVITTDSEPKEESASRLTSYILKELNLFNYPNVPLSKELSL
ncbi:adenylyl-sulfate kinase [Solitalea canadensis]|uniref:Adenylyl-sulfate kinase n=1 Tax=Solitalea canadensis (strain ATCC 29591 / DSM 3403 / JCM 21819 / LMG 8368 / NBRC 15130 / NCIMB 12057 / USAM 9D) TaxID=929556 RepID=H8KRR4_SOLCM|nr:adenylyl-sulfate kinase [Solitalea canadensis]AFD07702.1 adenylylsulfate kinase ApsK [Solitalea canadensis DSM 3403]